MKIIFSPLAEKQLRKLPKLAQIAIAEKVRNLRNGRSVNTRKLSGYKNIFRSRVGNYRLVFKQSSDSIYVVAIGHRKEIYKILDRFLR